MSTRLGESVAQAILRREGQSRLTTSSQRLDDAFVSGLHPVGVNDNITNTDANSDNRLGGIPRATVGEIVGPPGIGKTTLALQVAVNSIKSGESVIWIDTSSIFPGSRLRSIISADVPETSVRPFLSQFHSLSVGSLAPLLALLLYNAHSESSIFSKIPKLGLLVIDDLSTPVLAAYPTRYEEDTRNKPNRKDYTDSAATKRNNVLKELANKLASLAVKKNIAILVLNQLTTKVTFGNIASLVPALGEAWTSNCSYRITLYRQYLSSDYCERSQDVRFAYFQKCEGIVVKDEDAQNIPFLITDSGIEDVVFPEDSTPKKHSIDDAEVAEISPKRRRVLSFAEVVDDSEAEGEDFLLTGQEIAGFPEP